jgi:AcrR family transcriptional regulator
MAPRKPPVAHGDDDGRQRRRRGEPKRLLLESAKDVFNRKGYSKASTREIAEQAGVSETLIFRNFTNKAGLFREAMVRPFVDAIDSAMEQPAPQSIEGSFEFTRAFVASIYDVFAAHRCLAPMVFAAGALVESEVADSSVIDEVRDALDRFVAYAADAARAGGLQVDPEVHDLAIRGHLAMVAGVATFGPWYRGKRKPSRAAVVDELTQWVWLRYSVLWPPEATRRGHR